MSQNADSVRGRILSPMDLFPPKGHRYLTDERIEVLCQKAYSGEPVTLDALTLTELICDWRNMSAQIDSSGAQS